MTSQIVRPHALGSCLATSHPDSLEAFSLLLVHPCLRTPLAALLALSSRAGEFYGEAVDILIVFEAQSFGQAAAE